MNNVDLYFSVNVFAYFGIKVMLTYKTSEKKFPLALFSERTGAVLVLFLFEAFNIIHH